MKTYIRSIGIANPEHKISQEKIQEFMVHAFNFNDEEKVKQKVLYRASGVKFRYSVLEDYGVQREDFSFYPKESDMEPFPSTDRRMQVYKNEAIKLSINAVRDCLESDEDIAPQHFTHLITVSCTGFYAPGIDIELVEQIGLSPEIERTGVNFMGCYAAFNAIKLGNYICKADPKAVVLIVCVELCSLHFQKVPTEDNILANALFGDGAAAVILSSVPSKGINLEIEKQYNTLALHGKHEMAWHIGNFGFQMKLSKYVPEIVRNGIKELSHKLIEHLKLNIDQIDYFAVHPGGKKILEQIEHELDIPKEKNEYAYKVLKKYGNMSSPTVLFVLCALTRNLNDQDNGKNIVSFAFGPGLTLEGILYKIRHF